MRIIGIIWKNNGTKSRLVSHMPNLSTGAQSVHQSVQIYHTISRKATIPTGIKFARCKRDVGTPGIWGPRPHIPSNMGTPSAPFH